MFINPPEEYEIYTKENGGAMKVLLEILIKAESTETDREMMNFRLAGGKISQGCFFVMHMYMLKYVNPFNPLSTNGKLSRHENLTFLWTWTLRYLGAS